jgi:hypothetical protein
MYCYKTTNKCVEEVAGFINAFLDLPQHVTASHCHHQGVVVFSGTTQAVCIVDVYRLRPIQSGQLSRDVTKCVQWVQFLQQLNPLYTLGYTA